MLKISGLTKQYKGQNAPAVSGLDLEVRPGEIMAFLGPNGAGKSTTIKCITGILPYDTGSIEICGYNLKSDPIQAKMNIGFVPDNHATYENLTAIDYINFICNIYRVPVEERKERIDELAEMMSLTQAMNKPINSFSHGMKQKVSVIAALVHKPKLWILDEPMTGLDPKSAHVLKELMRKHCDEGNSVFFSSHVLEVVEKLCDRLAIIKGGELIEVMSMDALRDKKSDLSLEEFFLSVTDNNYESEHSYTEE
ncbi:MAG: ABC transporter ATP-binding protein [Clostridia bacterium]|nr:ABC transporter ATP-binding protein [Clostridia bacterium]